MATDFLWDEPLAPDRSTQLTAITRPLASSLPRASATGPITFAVYGPWGSGKTTFLRYLRHEVDPKAEDPNASPKSRRDAAQAISIWFEPWRYEREPDLIIPLLTEITAYAQKSISDNRVKSAAVKTGMRLLGRVAKAAARTATGFIADRIGVEREDIERIGQDFMSLYEDEGNRFAYPESENEQFKRDFSQLIELAATGRKNASLDDANARSVMIFLDDLDRCASDQVKRLLESMKNFLWVPGVVYVLALDRTQVTLALAEPYVDIFKGSDSDPLARARERAKNYLEKFFLYAFDIGDGAGRFEQVVIEPVAAQLFVDLQNEFPTLGLAEYERVFAQASPNLRRLKRIVRWLYYELQIDPHRADLLQFFAEQVFSENYGRIWLNQFDGQGLQSRASFYTRIFEALSVFVDLHDEFSFDADAKEGFLDAVRTRPDHGQASDGLLSTSRPGFEGAGNLVETEIGAWLEHLVDSENVSELECIYRLVSDARHIARREGRL